MKKTILLLLIMSVSCVMASNSDIYGYYNSYLPNMNTDDSTTTNVFINNTNSSNYWNTNLGSLGNVNSTQFENNGGTLSILESWILSLFSLSNHNELAGLQGGEVEYRGHLNQSQHNKYDSLLNQTDIDDLGYAKYQFENNSFNGSGTLQINEITWQGNGTVGGTYDDGSDYYIFFKSNNIPTNAGSGVYYMRLINGIGEGLKQKISNLADSAPPGNNGTLTMPNGEILNIINSGDSFDIYLQNGVTDDLNKVEIEGDVSVWGLMFKTIRQTLNVIISDGSTSKAPDNLFYLTGCNGADYADNKTVGTAGNGTIILGNGGGYAYDGGNGATYYVYGGEGGSPAYNGGNASVIHWILSKGGVGTVNGVDGILRIGTLTNFVEFTYAGITKMKDLLLSGDLKIEDNNKIYLGDSDDSSIYYDSNNLHVNPAELGDGQFVLDGDGYYLYDSYRWKSHQGGYRSNSNPVSSFEGASYGYGALLPNGLTKYDITNYIIPDDARANGTIQLMLDFIGNESVMTGNEIIRISQRVGGMTKNEGGQYIMPTVYRNINLSKYNYQNDKWMHINTNNLTNINPGDYFSVLTYRYGADSNDNYNGSIYTPYAWKIKYQSEIA